MSDFDALIRQITFASGTEKGTQNCKLAEPITIVVEGGGNCVEANWRGEGGLARARDIFTVSQSGLGVGGSSSAAIFRGLIVVNPTPTMKNGSYKAVGGKKRTFEVEIKLAFLPEQDAQAMLSTIINSCLGDIGAAVTSVDIGLGATFTRGDTYPNYQNLGAYLDATVPQYGCMWGVDALGALFVKPTIAPESINNVFYDICAVEHEVVSEELITAIRWILATDVIFHDCNIISNRIQVAGNVNMGASGINSSGVARGAITTASNIGEINPKFLSGTGGGGGGGGYGGGGSGSGAGQPKAENVRYALLTYRSSGSGPQEAVQSRALNPWSQWYKLLEPVAVIASHALNPERVLDGDLTSFSRAYNYSGHTTNDGIAADSGGTARGVDVNDYFSVAVQLPIETRGVFITYSGATAGTVLLEYIGDSGKRQLCEFNLPPVSSPTEVKIIVPIDARCSANGVLVEANVYIWSGQTFDFRVYEVKALGIDTQLLDNFAQVLYRTDNAGSKRMPGYVAPTGGFNTYTYEIDGKGKIYTTISTERSSNYEEAVFAAIVRANEHRATDNAVRHAGGK